MKVLPGNLITQIQTFITTFYVFFLRIGDIFSSCFTIIWKCSMNILNWVDKWKKKVHLERCNIDKIFSQEFFNLFRCFYPQFLNQPYKTLILYTFSQILDRHICLFLVISIEGCVLMSAWKNLLLGSDPSFSVSFTQK